MSIKLMTKDSCIHTENHMVKNDFLKNGDFIEEFKNIITLAKCFYCGMKIFTQEIFNLIIM